MGAREQGVGAEGDGDNEDIANFKMESDGLSMVSVSIDEEGSHSSGSEEEHDSHSTSSPQAMPSSPSSFCSHPSTSAPSTSLDMPCSYLSSSPSSSSSSILSSSCLGPADLASPCGSHCPDSACGSGHASPLLGPRSQCSGASSPDCDQERGDRAEGAEATLEAGLKKLTVTVAQKQEGDSADEQDPHYTDPEISSPGSAATILLLNSV